MKNIGTCKLCKIEAIALRDSHIIPELFYKETYTEYHKFKPISISSNGNYKFEQKGYRERLFCQACETRFSVWEGKLAQLLDQIMTNNFTSITMHKIPDIENGLILTNVDYAPIKKGILSIFWRMGITTVPFFKNYDLGSYSEEIRVILDSDYIPEEQEFPIQLSKVLIGADFCKGLIFNLRKSRFDKFTMQSVVLKGFLFDCVMINKVKIPNDSISKFISMGLQSCGKMIVVDQLYRELIPDLNHFSNKIKQSKIKEFYTQH